MCVRYIDGYRVKENMSYVYSGAYTGHGYWETNSYSLGEPQVLLTPDPSFQPL